MICDYLKEFRKKMGFTQQDIADILGVERSTYTYYETGKTEIPTKKLHTLSKLYNIDINDFFDSNKIILNDPNKENSKKSEVGMLTKEEKDLLVKIRLLGSSKRFELYQFLNELTNDENNK